MTIVYKGDMTGEVNTPYPIVSTYTAGAPITTDNTSINSNLNAKFLNGQAASYYSKKFYTINLRADGAINPLDGWTYYFGLGVAPNVYGIGVFIIPKSGIIIGWSIFTQCVLTPPSANSWKFYLRKNTTDYLLFNSYSTASLINVTNNFANIPVEAGDPVIIKVVCPTWSTNPEGVLHTGNILIEV